MLTQSYNLKRFLSSRWLTAIIVGSVVLINSVAWGIPLLVSTPQAQIEAASKPAFDSRSVTTGALPQSKPVRGRQTVMVPLPQQARPALQVRRKRQTLSPNSAPVLAERGRAPLKNAAPAALYPRPEPAALSPLPNVKKSANRQIGRPAHPAVVRKPPVRDIVMVSPYTPGVRVAPTDRGYAWRHHTPRSSSGLSTLDTAKAIARRAAKRFEDMRNRIAKLDKRNKELAMQERRRRRALLPVAPRPPRIVNNGDNRSAVKSAYKNLRPRLVRRPLGSSDTKQTATLRTARLQNRARNLSAISGSTPNQMRRRVQRPTRVARLLHATRRPQDAQSGDRTAERNKRLAAVRIETGRRSSQRTKTRSNIGGATGQEDRTERRRRRARRSTINRRSSHRRSAHRRWRSSARRSQRARRRGGRRIDGFRRNFHRQLANVGFFGSGNSN